MQNIVKIINSILFLSGMVDREFILWSNVVVFSVVLILHLVRGIWGLELTLGTWGVPVWFSIIAVLLLGFLVVVNWRLLHK